MTNFDVRELHSGDPMTADERENLISEGLSIYDHDLLKAYRSGFLDGLDNATSSP